MWWREKKFTVKIAKLKNKVVELYTILKNKNPFYFINLTMIFLGIDRSIYLILEHVDMLIACKKKKKSPHQNKREIVEEIDTDWKKLRKINSRLVQQIMGP